ncbi:plastocyanin/azurin family copper-binding protein [Halopiger djelfimassiliensis]|uniref:plastocyanin/azurin family copper-binding protein n=1 Tax=Halopiger djelfimassiliensis TaxID=1293047 RepID=UPI0009DB869F|nr:plastocyanin/azurin family copper-binding protein [Halopiger djelfimassiliensis]
MSPPTDRTEESTDRPRVEWFGFERRSLLQALGAGASLSLASGTASASGEESDGEVAAAETAEERTDERNGSNRIDPVFGYPTTDAEGIPAGLEPDHVVELHREFPEDPADPERTSVFHFEPSGLHVSAGDIVAFVYTDPNHTITAYHPGHGFQRRVPEGVPAFSSPIVQKDGAWLYRFERDGVYDLYCGPHEIAGMAMRIVVGELVEGELPDYVESFEAEPPLFAPLSPAALENELNAESTPNDDCEWPWPTDGQVLASEALDPLAVQEAGEVPFAAVADELGVVFDHDDTDETTPTVQARDHPEYGTVLVGPDGMTVYAFDNDVQGAGESACTGECADAWPPLTVEGEPVAGDDVAASLETFDRETGETQVMAAGRPLYYFARDEEPGDAEGQGVNDVWWVLDPSGAPIRTE